MKKTLVTQATLFICTLLLCWATCKAKEAEIPPRLKAQKVYVGAYVMNLYEINPDAHSFYADFYLWFRWKGDIDPTGIEIVNRIEDWGANDEPFADTVTVLKDGFKYNGLRMEGRFFHPFEMERFPIDRHVLDIQIENADYPVDSIVYLPDTASLMRMKPDLRLPGWNIEGCRLISKTHMYATDFGNTDLGQEPYSNIVLEIPIARPVTYFLLKLMLPLIIVLLSSIGALVIFPSRSYVDARISLPIGGLLTAVFLQQSYSDALPDVGYMVLMDKVYLLAYAVIGAVVMEIILSANYLKRNKNTDLHALRRIEWYMALFLILGFLAGNLLLVFL
ncbi:hypothetical protein C7N43_19850 [Sphingobacteriales bacterium UPWRP_1]|nr:hypothetical protein BVG80_02570 [Sphingobacteriales bacterium TSM_CSM]PSJ75241.1 hypothetical protein C7N43_19850 [Sphingobacteriales bacterium UPWRP_1]